MLIIIIIIITTAAATVAAWTILRWGERGLSGDKDGKEKSRWEAPRDDECLDAGGHHQCRPVQEGRRRPAGGADPLLVGCEVSWGEKEARMTTVLCLVFTGAEGGWVERKHLFGNILEPTEKLQE